MRLSVYVTDCVFGMAATDVGVLLLRRRIESGWDELARGRTGSDGRLAVWSGQPIDVGVYQLIFDLDGYYAILGTVALYPRAIVEFRVSDPDADLHLPLMMTSNSYLTYRGGP
jgi:5-hydroxyisourate hydrolase